MSLHTFLYEVTYDSTRIMDKNPQFEMWYAIVQSAQNCISNNTFLNMPTVLETRTKWVESANDHAIRYFTIHRHFLKIISNISKNMAPYFYYCRIYKLGTYRHNW